MRVVVGILLLLVSLSIPMGMLVWLNSRMRRQPHPSALQIGMILALNGILPLAVLLVGLGLMSPRFGSTTGVRVAVSACTVAAVVLLLGLWWTRRAAKRAGDSDGQ
jgi:uncharacterized membrane protein (GlpM family)